MTTAVARPVTRAGGALARERLAAYQRYAELVEGQEAALEAGDLEAFDAMSWAALDLQATLGAAAALRHLEDDPEAGQASFVDQVTALLRSTMARNERIQARLHHLRDEAGRDIRTAGTNRPRVRSYVQGGADLDRHNLDFRF